MKRDGEILWLKGRLTEYKNYDAENWRTAAKSGDNLNVQGNKSFVKAFL